MNRLYRLSRASLSIICLLGVATPASAAIVVWDEASGTNPMSNAAASPTSLGNLTTIGDYQIIGQATRNEADPLNKLGFDIMSLSLDGTRTISSATLEVTGISPAESTMTASAILHSDPPNYATPLGANSFVAVGGGSEDLLAALGLGSIGPGGAYQMWFGNNGSDGSTMDYTLTFTLIPEPASLLLLLGGAAWMLKARRTGNR